MDSTVCSRCNRNTKGLYTCSICRREACTKCFLDNLMMCKSCLQKA